MNDHYQILGITPAADAAEIKAAFKLKARMYHPDKHGGDVLMEERFKEINLAYQVLSNPYERARYDLMRNFGSTVVEEASTQTTNTSNEYPPYARPYYDPRIRYRENWIATAYAFGFTLVVAVIIMTGVSIKQYYDDKARNEMLNRRRASFEQAQQDYQKGNIEGAMKIMDQLGAFLKNEDDLESFKSDLIHDVTSKGLASFNSGDYKNAIFYFELLREYARIPALELKENLALSYKKIHHPVKSIAIFNELIISGYRNLFTYVEVAEIYRDILKDYKSANNYYISANEIAKDYYKTMYGEAYAVILDGHQLPEIHYRLYTGLADSYLRIGKYEKAIKAVSWNKRMWPDSAENYLIAAKGFRKLNQIRNACEYYTIAKTLDNSVILPSYCR